MELVGPDHRYYVCTVFRQRTILIYQALDATINEIRVFLTFLQLFVHVQQKDPKLYS